VRAQLQQILVETEEDLTIYKRLLNSTVHECRPNLPNKDSFVWHQTEGGGAPLPPLTPRDWQITMGDKLLRVLAMPELDEICADFADQWSIHTKAPGIKTVYLNQASASCIVRVGTDVFFDNSDFCVQIKLPGLWKIV
jgi:hypothetical protein